MWVDIHFALFWFYELGVAVIIYVYVFLCLHVLDL